MKRPQHIGFRTKNRGGAGELQILSPDYQHAAAERADFDSFMVV
jgi:hypothetical protein